MTHDELLVLLDERLGCADVLALRAVVELQSPALGYGDFPDDDTTCDHCGRLNSAEMVPYPCPTIQAIEKELG